MVSLCVLVTMLVMVVDQAYAADAAPDMFMVGWLNQVAQAVAGAMVKVKEIWGTYIQSDTQFKAMIKDLIGPQLKFLVDTVKHMMA